MNKEDLIKKHKPTGAVQYNIICCHCKGDSGYTNDDAKYFKANMRVRCRACGEHCLCVMAGEKAVVIDDIGSDKLKLIPR